VVAPGAYDALSARLVEQAGFDVASMTGFGSTASLVARTDTAAVEGLDAAIRGERFGAP
jgi:2-methylisocitrate lyase-like PEP mutase family enzyme